MSDQADTERKRQERARLASAFSRRAWQPSEKPKIPMRIFAGGIALAVVAAAAFGIGALISYQQGIEEEQKKKKAANQRAVQAATAPSPNASSSETSRTPSPSPKREADAQPQRKPSTPTPTPTRTSKPKPKTKSKSRFPTGPTFSTVTGVLIRNRMTGLCVDIPDHGNGSLEGRVEQFTCNGTSKDNQLWDLVVNQKGAGPRGADLFTIRNSKDGYCLDLPGVGKPAATTAVMEMYCYPGSSDNQMWYLDKKKSGQFWIRNHSSNGLCLDVAGTLGSGGPAADLTVYPCSSTDDHVWSFR